MRIGFTGTRHGMAPAQANRFYAYVCEHPDFEEFHHGDCIGADSEAADAIRDVLTSEDPGPAIKVVCHPPADQTHRAHNPHYDEIREPKTHFARNRDIVDETDCLVACPCDMAEQPKGGTWYTVGYARKRGKPVVIIWPDGTITEEKR